MPIDVKQYDSAIDFIRDDDDFTRLVGNLSSNDDRLRLKAYLLYEDMYNNRPEHIRIILRSDDTEDSVEIYVPSAKKCIEAVNRFLCVNYSIKPHPNVQVDDRITIIATLLEDLFKRERMKSKFSQMKRYMLIKGDALIHIKADKRKRPGKKISIEELKPEHYFPIEDKVTGDIIGCHIVDIIDNPKDTIRTRMHTHDLVVRRQTYRRVLDNNHNPTGPITSELSLWEIAKWDDRVLEDKDLHKLEQVVEPFELPDPINQLPVYHWRNTPPPGSTFGMSELAGVESIVNAINQSMSDEDLTLVMQGLGVYWTDASPPLNDRGDEVEWEISPRSVVQVASGGQFARVSGITTVQPFGDHIKALDEAMQQALGVPDIAIGVVDVTTAESGIALELKLGPLLAKNAEKEVDVTDVCDQFLYDLIQGWMPAYEDIETSGAIFISSFEDPMPKNKSKDLQDLISLWGSAQSILPVAWFYEQLNTIMGYHLDPDGDFEQALADAQRIVESQQPPQPELPPGADEMAGAGASGNGQA
jgi:hypothetical protein